MHRHAEFGGGGFDRGENGEIVLERADVRHEYVEAAIARFNRQSGPYDGVPWRAELQGPGSGSGGFGSAGSLR